MMPKSSAFFKYIIFVFFLLAFGSVAFADGGSVEVEWNIQDGDYYFRGTQNDDCYLRIEDCHCVNSPGNPALPVRIYRIILPPDSDLKSVKVCLAEAYGNLLEGTYSIAAANPYYVGENGPFWGENEDSVVSGKNRAVYDSDEVYPYTAVKVHDTGQMRKWKFVRIHFTPVRYRPKSGKLELIKRAKIRVTYDRGSQHAISAKLLNDSVFDEIAKRTFDNYDAAKQWYTMPVAPCAYAGEKGYAILTTSGVADSGCLNDFIAHKEDQGFTVHVVTSNHKNWLAGNYASKHIVYSLILAHPYTISPGSADLGYTDLTGDMAPEVFTGRFEEDDQNQHRTDEDWMTVPVGIDAITKYLQRVINYETATDTDYRKKALFSNDFIPDFTDLIVAGFTRAGGFEVTSGGGYAISNEWKKEPFGVIQQRSHGLTHKIKYHFSKKDCSEIPWTDKPAVVHIIACHCGEYTDHSAATMNSISLCMLKTCAIAVMGNDGAATGWPSWDGPERGYVENLGWFFHKELAIHGATVGEAHCLGKFYSTDFPQPDYNEFNLKGDPSIRVQVGNELKIIAKRPLEYARIGRTYKEMLGAVGGEKPYIWTLEEGDLPPGIELLEDGMLIGTPSSAGGYPFKVKVTDATGLAVDVAWLQIDCGDSGILDNPPLPDAVVGKYYAYVLTTQQGSSSDAYTWSWSGNTPPGLSLSQHAGIISGTATTSGTYTFTVNVKNVSKEFTLTVIDPDKLRIVTECLYNAALDGVYSQTLKASGGTGNYTWSVAAGELPPGLTLDSNSGVISGTPTQTGKYEFTAEVTDGSSTAQKELYVEVIDTEAPLPLQIITTYLPNGVSGEAYNISLAALGGTPPYTWSLSGGSLPSGLDLSMAGEISGTPTEAGIFDFSVQVTDFASSTVSKDMSITVTDGGATPLAITTASLPDGVAGSMYSATLTATGGMLPYNWTVSSGSLPPGLNLSSSGSITGTPSSSGTYSFRIRVTDSALGTAEKDFTVEILPAGSLVITTASLPYGEITKAYSVDLEVTGGVLPYTWSIDSGTLPPGITLDSATGSISGVPSAAGTYIFTVRVDDNASAFASKQFSIAVDPSSSPAPIPIKKKSGGCALSAEPSSPGSAAGTLVPYISLLLFLGAASILTRRKGKQASKRRVV
jgi:hypothetical protein